MESPPRPRRRRAPTRGLRFGASLDRLPAPETVGGGRFGAGRRDEPLPIALIGEASRVAPAPIAGYGSMAAAWPLVDRPGASGPGAVDASSGATGGALGGLSAAEWDRMLGR